MRKSWIIWTLAAFLLIISLHGLAQIASPVSLRPAISAQYRGVDWVNTSTLENWMRDPNSRNLALLDVREIPEFNASHLRHARRVDPDLTNVSSLGLSRDATVVVYCSVGYRSAALAQRLSAAGFRRVFNLEGGLFQWANEGRPLYRGDQRAQKVHPYDASWGLMLFERYRLPLD